MDTETEGLAKRRENSRARVGARVSESEWKSERTYTQSIKCNQIRNGNWKCRRADKGNNAQREYYGLLFATKSRERTIMAIGICAPYRPAVVLFVVISALTNGRLICSAKSVRQLGSATRPSKAAYTLLK